MKRILGLFLSVGVLIFTSGQVFAKARPKDATTVSERYSNLSDDNEARMLFTAGQMDKLKSSLLKSSNFTGVTKLLTPLFDGQKVRKTISLDKHHNLVWLDNGIEKSSQIVVVDLTQSTPNQEIYSNFQEGLGVADIIIDFSLSPNGKYVDVVSSKYGSIDQVDCFVINVETHEAVQLLNMTSNMRAWNSANTLLYDKLNDDGSDSFAQFDFSTMQETGFDGYIVGSNSDVVLLANITETMKWYSVQNKSDASVINLDWPIADEPQLIGTDANYTYLFAYDTTEKASEIIKLPRHSLKYQRIESPSVLIKEPNFFLEKAWFDNNAIFAQFRAGADRWIRVYSNEGPQLGQLTVPDCCSVLSTSWSKPMTSLKFVLSSALFSSLIFNYDLTTQTWDQDPNLNMLNDRDLHLVSDVVYSTSADGTKIPSRLTHLKDLVQDASHPVVIQTYGGFNLAGYVDPHFDATNLEFIKRGGIFAAPAARGGNEYGPSWHTQAMLTNKVKTFEDVASVSDFLVAQKWTQTKLIASRGTSNGGLTVAATALLFPDKFGLAIPIAGVHDLLAKDILDSVNGGWSEEYGADSDQSEFLKTISPVENASHLGNVKFLIVDGANDTRVNPVHSVKLAKALEDLGGNPSAVNLLTMQNAGTGLSLFLTKIQ